MSEPLMPFGRHKDAALGTIPVDYLRWALAKVKLSSGLRAAVEAEVARRGGTIPAPPPPKAPPTCRRCPGAKVDYRWAVDSLGRKQIRRSCRKCGGGLGHAPQVSPYTELADAASSKTPLLDALLLADEQSVALCSDGKVAGFATSPDYRKASPELRDAVRACKMTLGSMLGRTIPREENRTRD